MGRYLRYLGLCVLTAVAWLVLAESVGWVGPGLAEPWVVPAAKIGAALLVVGVVASVLAPVRLAVSRGRCARCRAPIERGQTYCLDHLRQTVAEYQDQERTMSRGRRRLRID